MPWDRKRLLGYVETIQLLLGGTDKLCYPFTTMGDIHLSKHALMRLLIYLPIAVRRTFYVAK